MGMVFEDLSVYIRVMQPIRQGYSAETVSDKETPRSHRMLFPLILL